MATPNAEYRGKVVALAIQVIAVSWLITGVSVAVSAITGDTNGLFAFAMLATGIGAAWLAWSYCYWATLDGDHISFRQLTGTRHAALSDIKKVSIWTGEGGSKTYVLRLAHGRAFFEGRRAADFFDALLRADPTITRPKGWEPTKDR